MVAWVKKYIDAVEEWDRSHRLVGTKNFELLFQESREALFASVPRETLGLVDIGAGSGVLGFAFLELRPDTFSIFVEEDLKKAAFLLYFLTALAPELSDRAKVISSPYQHVSRETVDQFARKRKYQLAARAFSGKQTLKQVHSRSAFSDQAVYSFEVAQNDEKKPIFRLAPLEK